MSAAVQQPHPIQVNCTAEEARALTDQIKGSVERTWGLLIAAYERQAWKALDYTSWGSYVTAEFGIRRSRSYQLIDHSIVVSQIAAAADVHTVDLPEGAVRGMKPHLAEVTEQVREAVAGVSDEQLRADVAEQVTRAARDQFLADRATGEVLSPQDWAARNPSRTGTPGGEGQGNEAPETDTSTSPPGQPVWSPSGVLDQPAKPSKAPATSKSSRPQSLEEQFADASRALHKAVNEIERLSADGRFVVYAAKLDKKHRRGIDDAVEGLTAVLTRLRDVAGRAK